MEWDEIEESQKASQIVQNQTPSLIPRPLPDFISHPLMY